MGVHVRRNMQVLGIVYRALAAHIIEKTGFTQKQARTGTVTLIQRFGSALNLNIHFHILFLDGVYTDEYRHENSGPRFRNVKAPTQAELTKMVHTIIHRIARFLERKGLLVQDAENAYRDLPPDDESPMDTIMGHSITYRIAAGPNAGRKVFTLQTIPAFEDEGSSRVASANGISLHAGVATTAKERDKLERVCRYITRPAVSEKPLSLTKNGNIRYGLKTPYSDGTTHVIFEPLDFLSRLAALVPRPLINLTRFHGVFAPNSKHRALVTLARRGKGNKRISPALSEEKTPTERRSAMTWAQRLRRVFNIDVLTCGECGGQLKVIAAIEDPQVIKQILGHLERKAQGVKPFLVPESRAPPVANG